MITTHNGKMHLRPATNKGAMIGVSLDEQKRTQEIRPGLKQVIISARIPNE
jgi:hypothetical protein